MNAKSFLTSENYENDWNPVVSTNENIVNQRIKLAGKVNCFFPLLRCIVSLPFIARKKTENMKNWKYEDNPQFMIIIYGLWLMILSIAS